MANRIIPIETKVNALSQCLALLNVEVVAKELGVAPNSIRNWFETKVLANLPEVLEKEQPGPKVKAAGQACVPPKGNVLRRPGKLMRSGSLSRLSECAGLEEWVILGDQLVGISQPALVQPVTRGDPTLSLWDCAGRLLHRNGSVWRKRATRLAILETVSGIQQIQVALIRPPYCPAGGLCLWPGHLRYVVSQVTDSADSKPRRR